MPIANLLLILTAPRSGADYAPALIRDVLDQRPDELMVSVLQDSPTIGQARMLWRAFKLAEDLGAERLTVLEDDIELVRGAVPYMAQSEIPGDIAFVSWFDGHQCERHTVWGLHPFPVATFFCNQALTFPRRTVRRLLADRRIDTWERHRGDILVRLVLAGESYGVQVPNLVQHIGEVSLCNPGVSVGAPGRGRRATNFPGRDFDAIDLLREQGASTDEGEQQ